MQWSVTRLRKFDQQFYWWNSENFEFRFLFWLNRLLIILASILNLFVGTLDGRPDTTSS